MGMMKERFMSLQEASARDNPPSSVIPATERQIFKVNAHLPKFRHSHKNENPKELSHKSNN
jgi:hypothetical protein